MTDAQLAKFLGFKPEDDQEKVTQYIIDIPPDRRALYEHMADIATALQLWSKGLGPKPGGVIVCEEH